MRLLVASLALLAGACGSSSTGPSATESRLTVTSVSPPSGSTIVVPEALPYILPGGVALPAGSGLVSVGISMASAHDVPWAQLSVYLLTGDGQYCGQNTPDSPTWQFLSAGWATTHTVTGFRVYRLPCDVTAIRAMLHMRNNGLLTPPTSSETIAEATLPVSIRIRR